MPQLALAAIGGCHDDAIRVTVEEGWFAKCEIDAQEDVRFVRETCHR